METNQQAELQLQHNDLWRWLKGGRGLKNLFKVKILLMWQEFDLLFFWLDAILNADS